MMPLDGVPLSPALILGYLRVRERFEGRIEEIRGIRGEERLP
jgi:hypothetical protein